MNLKEKNISNYCLVLLALIHSELCWMCSVVYCLFKESGLVEEEKPHHDTDRIPTPSPSCIIPVDKPAHSKNTTVTFAEEDHTPIRHLSINNDIHDIPTEYEERNGITCPPKWWQKTRVMLGHAPIHGYPRSTESPFIKHKTKKVCCSKPVESAYKTPSIHSVDSSSSGSSGSRNPRKKKIISRINAALSPSRRASIESKFRRLIK